MEISSISIDKDRQVSAKYNKGSFEISWYSSWEAGEFNSSIADILESDSYTEIALDEDLKGSKFDKRS